MDSNLVSINLAKRAKELGFDIPTPFKFYTQRYEGDILVKTDAYLMGGIQNWNGDSPELELIKKKHNYINTISRPTYDQLAEWAKKHNKLIFQDDQVLEESGS